MPSILNATTTSGLVTSADNSGSLQLQTNNGTTAVTINTSQNVGIGTTTPSGKLHTFSTAQDSTVQFEAGTAGYASNLNLIANTAPGGAYNNITSFSGGSAEWRIGGSGNNNTIVFSTGSGYTERMRVSSGGTLFIGGTSSPTGTQRLVLTANGGDGIEPMLFNELRSTSATENYVRFYRNGSQVGNITNTLSATAYNTSSDYRLKENITPMSGALAKVAQLKPVTYTWKVDGSNGQGFIAHELQAVVPDCVTGEKDAVDEEGNPRYQGVDTSFLVATLTAAIQELKAELDATKAEVQALKGVA